MKRKPADTRIDRSFINSFFIVSSLTFLAKMAIVCKELVVASRYGRQDEADAFLIAFLVPSFIVVILGNAMNAAFIPVYIQVREKEGPDAARKLFAGMSFLVVCGSLLIAGLIYLLAPVFLPMIASGFGPAKLAMTMHMLMLVIPYVVFYGILSLWTAALNAQENFTAVVLSPVVSPLLIILLFFFFPSLGIWSLVYGTVAGAGLELVLVGAMLRRRGFPLRVRGGIGLWSRGVAFGARGFLARAGAVGVPGSVGSGLVRMGPVYMPGSVRRVVMQFIPALAGAFLMSSAVIVDQSMAAMLPAGSVAALSYGNKVIGFLLTILSTTLITILTPYFSKKMAGSGGGAMVGSGGAEMVGSLRRSLLWVFLFSCLLPVIITIWSGPIVKFVFYRGAFTLADVRLVAGVQSFLAWQIPFYITSVILLKFIASMQANWIQAVVASVNLTLNIILNFLLMQRMGVYGIALSTSLVYVVSVLMLALLLRYAVKKRGTETRGAGGVGGLGAGAADSWERGETGSEVGGAADDAGAGVGAGEGKTVLHIITGLGIGGAERMLVNLVSGAVGSVVGGISDGGAGREPAGGPGQVRHVVISLSREEEGVLAEELVSIGVPVHFLGMKAGSLPGPDALIGLIRLSRKINPDLIQGWMYHGNLAAVWVRIFLRGKRPMIWTIHHSIGVLDREKKMTRLLIRLGARLSGRPERIVYVSQLSRRQHIALGYRDERGCTIPNGIDTEVFKPAVEGWEALVRAREAAAAGESGSELPGGRGALLGELGIGGDGLGGAGAGSWSAGGADGGPLLIGHFARYHPLKDHANFLRAAGRLCAKYRQIQFIMAGKGVDGNNLELTGLLRELGMWGEGGAGFGGRVHLLGMRRDLEKLYPALDIFCLSSSAEALPLTLLEAMSSGLPCVTTDVGDAAPLVGETGLSVPPHDHEALARALGSLVEAGPEKRKMLGRAAREKIVADYSLEAFLSSYTGLYEELMGGSDAGEWGG